MPSFSQSCINLSYICWVPDDMVDIIMGDVGQKFCIFKLWYHSQDHGMSAPWDTGRGWSQEETVLHWLEGILCMQWQVTHLCCSYLSPFLFPWPHHWGSHGGIHVNQAPTHCPQNKFYSLMVKIWSTDNNVQYHGPRHSGKALHENIAGLNIAKLS